MGDLKYQDLNKDGVINDKDMAPIDNGNIPQYLYGINGQLKYKNFDLNFVFNGTGNYNTVFSGMGIYETDYDGVFGSIHKNAWTQERWNNGEKITYPALSTKTSTNHRASDFFVQNRKYFKLKSLELGYTLLRVRSRASASASCGWCCRVRIYSPSTISRATTSDERATTAAFLSIVPTA